MKSNKNIELRILKAILWIYIILCILIAGLNYGYVSRATPKVASFITWLWQFYENWVKTLFIIIGSFLTIRIIGTSKRSVMRKRNLIGFIVSALIVHITAPILLNNKELYFFAMPLPWTTIPLQLLFPKSSFYLSSYPIWGEAGISAVLIFYVCVSIVVLVGTLLFGRRLQCSTLCLFNGFASEVFEPVIPLIGKNKKMEPIVIKIFSILRWVFLLISVFFTVWWISLLLGTPITENFKIISKIENYKYLTTELMIAMFFWVAFIGRGYCYYCPLGTVLYFLGKIAGQQIITNKSKCIQCGQCNLACPMSIDIKSKAQSGDAVINIRCVGCGHCVDACPVKTLGYSTKFSNWISNNIK
ncbi:4Fe-4S binding protein [Clostridium estertheticum]|uniref:4Fe-4S binding protein n=1 Tax=Clostridium estertheticum TaxID=238834 RepID=UPI001CF2911D|nr:4Fe-4S binding protein [Clostridium estertheticum]MCB2356749.1 4Fe-4S binding protein [Clostridium estertheticum]WAG43519.1 4Fe-4S binding protein [Clostridium estertheticum]